MVLFLRSVTRTGRRLARKVFAENGEAIFRTRFAHMAKAALWRYEGSRQKSLAIVRARVGSIPRARRANNKKSTTFRGAFFIVGDAYGNRTHVTAVKGPCLNRLTNAPSMVAEVGFEPTTCRV